MTTKSAVEFNQTSAEDSTGFVFWQATLLWQRAIARALTPLDLTHVQFVLLASTAWLTRLHDEVTQTMIAKHAQTDMMMTSKVIRTLEEKSLLTRRAHSTDTRARAVGLTAKGRALVQRALGVVEQVDDNFFNRLGNNRARFHAGLLTLLAGAEA